MQEFQQNQSMRIELTSGLKLVEGLKLEFVRPLRRLSLSATSMEKKPFEIAKARQASPT